MEVLKFLELKNHCLEKLIQESKAFLSQSEQGDFSALQQFQEKRSASFLAFQMYDRKLTESILELKATGKKAPSIESIKQAEKLKDNMIQNILALDKQIMCRLEEQKIHLQRELVSSDKEQKLAAKFKSKWIPESGAKLDGKL